MFTNHANTCPDWGRETEECVNVDALPEPLQMYYASQCLAEKRFWKHAERNPQVDFTSSEYTHHAITMGL
jgi:hypothetical protein